MFLFSYFNFLFLRFYINIFILIFYYTILIFLFLHFYFNIPILAYINLLKPNDIHICRTAALTYRRYILNICSTNIHTEYFKHAA